MRFVSQEACGFFSEEAVEKFEEAQALEAAKNGSNAVAPLDGFAALAVERDRLVKNETQLRSWAVAVRKVGLKMTANEHVRKASVLAKQIQAITLRLNELHQM